MIAIPAKVVGTLEVLLALTSMDNFRFSERPSVGPLSEPYEFNDDGEQADEALTVELPRTTIRIEASSSTWWKLRWPLSSLLAIAVLSSDLVLIHTWGFSLSDHAHHSKFVVTSRRYRSPTHESTESHTAVRRSKAGLVTRTPHRHSRRKAGKRVNHTYSHAEWDSSTSSLASPAPVDHAPARSPAPHRRMRPKSEFSYLGR